MSNYSIERDGVRYKYNSIHYNRNDALIQAQKLRDAGEKVRIIKKPKILFRMPVHWEI